MFKVIVHRKAMREINSVPAIEKKRLLDVVKAMSLDPFSGDVKPVKSLKSVFRRRVGNYRIAFTVNFETNEVVVLKVSRRGKFYEEI